MPGASLVYLRDPWVTGAGAGAEAGEGVGGNRARLWRADRQEGRQLVTGGTG